MKVEKEMKYEAPEVEVLEVEVEMPIQIILHAQHQMLRCITIHQLHALFPGT